MEKTSQTVLQINRLTKIYPGDVTAVNIWCGISPMKLWENRGNAKEYLFGRALSQSDLDYVNEQKKRAPMIEASGKAEEYMANKYRSMPFSKQPSAQEKAEERLEMTQSFLEQMGQKEITRLEKEIEKTALKQKTGGYFPPETSLAKVKGYMTALIETIAIAVWGTLLALICAVPVSFFAAKNTLKLILSSDDMKSRTMRVAISFGVRRFLDSCRGFNEFVMALIFVAVIGLGPYAGFLIFDKLNGYLFREVCTMMIIIIMTVSIIDHLCSKIRMKFI